MAVRPRFDPDRNFVATRDFPFLGVAHAKGDPFDKSQCDTVRLSMLYEARMLDMTDDDTPADPVTITQISAGKYTVSVPWLDEPIKARGKVKAEEEAAKLREAGPPLGFIPGGSAVTLTGGDGGWYNVSAPWLAEPEKVQGREAAEARQRALHEAGEPQLEPVSEDDALVLIFVGDGVWTVSAAWLDTKEDFDTVEAAEARQAELREAGPPEGWERPTE